MQQIVPFQSTRFASTVKSKPRRWTHVESQIRWRGWWRVSSWSKCAVTEEHRRVSYVVMRMVFSVLPEYNNTWAVFSTLHYASTRTLVSHGSVVLVVSFCDFAKIQRSLLCGCWLPFWLWGWVIFPSGIVLIPQKCCLYFGFTTMFSENIFSSFCSENIV